MNVIFRILSIFPALLTLSPAQDFFPPVGDHAAELLVIGGPKEVEEIVRKMQRAIAEDPAWMKRYIEENELKPGEFLPYHKKFGVSEKEYQLFVESAGKLTLNKVGDVVVHVQNDNQNLVVFIEGAGFPVDSFEFSADGKSMSCKKGKTERREEINQRDATSPTGRWKGTRWILQEGKPEPGNDGDFFVLKITLGSDEEGRNLILLKIAGRQQGEVINVEGLARWPK